MRKCKFITGTISLTMALAVGVTSMAHMSVDVQKDKLVCEYETVTSSEPVEIVEKSVNEVTILTATEKSAEDITLETETKAPIISKVVKEAEETSKKELQSDKKESQTTKKEAQTTKKEAKSKKKSEDKKSENTKSDKEKKSSKKSTKSTLKSMGTYRVTAYCSCSYCCGKTNGITASGTKAKEGRTIAADTSVLPFGTEVVIDGETYTVEDRGGAIDGKRIDVYFDSHKKALKWGIKYLKVYVKK